MKTQIHSLLLSFILIVVFLGSSINTFSQTNDVYVELDNARAEYPIYIEVPNKGVIVFYLTIDKTTQFNIIFFDENLQEKWKITDIISSEKISKKYYKEAIIYSNDLKNGVVTPDGKYAYITNIVEDIVYRIDIATGKWKAIPLTKKLIKNNNGFPDGYIIDYNVDDNYYYLSEIGEFYMNSDISKRNKITVNRIKHGENKFESFSFSPTPANGKEKPGRFGADQHSSGDMQQWEVFFIKDNKIILKDNYPIHKDENNAFYRKMVVYNLEGNILSEANLPMGHTVSYTREYYSGVISYNKNKDKIYTFAYINDNEKSGTILYKCYDLNLKLLWEKTYTIKMEDYNKKKSSFFKQVNHNYDNTISLTTADDILTGDNKGSDLTTKSLCIEKDDYRNMKINCYEFEKAKKLSSNFIISDIKKHAVKNRVTFIHFFKVKNKIIYALETEYFGNYYRLASFDIK